MTATYCEHGYLVEGSRHECEQCTAPGRAARKWIAQQDPVRLRADAQALADVRTLDAWKKASRIRRVEESEPVDGCSLCELWDERDGFEVTELGMRVQLPFTAETPDEARAKAAAWVREQAKGAL